MQSIDTHPTFIRQTVGRHQADLATERRQALLAAAATAPAAHQSGRRGGSAPSSRLEQLARRVRSALGAAA